MDQLERKPGSIVRIKLENFMTFPSCEFRPGPRMNLILGPNGSGKSSLVCALCLGLGGQPKNLGRADDLQSFVKKGESTAKIEIELHDPKSGRNLVVERLFSSSANNSDWLVNGKLATQKAVLERLQRLAIQVDNLCQFLPQDKVQEFSQYTDKELLKETIRVVLGDDFLDRQKLLAERQKKSSGTQATLAAKTKTLLELEEDNKRNEATVQRQLEKATLQEKITLLEMKIGWLEFDRVRVEAVAAEDAFKQKEKELKDGSSTLQPLKRSADQCNKRLEKTKREFDQAVKGERGLADEVEKAHDAANSLLEGMAKQQELVDAVDVRKDKAVKKCELQRKAIAGLEAKLKERRGSDYYNAQINEAKLRVGPVSERAAEWSAKVTAAATEQSRAQHDMSRRIEPRLRELEQIVNVDSSAALARRQEQQERQNVDLIQQKLLQPRSITQPQFDTLMKYYRSSSGGGGKLLQGKLVGPLVCELRAVNEDAAQALEAYVPRGNWKFLVSTDERDQQTLTRDGLSNILVVGNAFPSPPRPDTYSPEVFRDAGIHGYLDQLVHADPVAIEGARRLIKLHHCLVGSAATDDLYNLRPDEFRRLLIPPARFTDRITIFTPTSRIDITRSHYGDREAILKRSGLNKNRPMGLPVHKHGAGNSVEEIALRAREAKAQAERDRAQLLQEKHKLDEQLAELKHRRDEADAENKQLDKEVKALRQEVNKLTKLRDDENKLEGKLDLEREKLVDCEKLVNQDWDAQVAKAKQVQAKLRQKLDKLLDDLSSTFSSSARRQQFEHLWQCNLDKAQADAERLAFTDLYRAEDERVKQLASKLEAFKKHAETLKEKAKRAMKAAKQRCLSYDTHREKFDQLPQTVQEAEEMLETAKYEIARIFTDPGALQRYEENLERITVLKSEVEELELKMGPEARLLQQDVDDWLGPVRDAVTEINAKFAKLFQRVSEEGGYFCRATVGLRSDPEQSLMDCGAEIFVTFRQDQGMQRLTPKVQSGGERSLSTFLYMLSLQSNSKVPFRVVDEINQGIDPSKERLAFNILSSTTSEHAAQYFMATPKLLPGLTYPNDATIIFLFNGPQALTQKQWDATPFVARKRQRAAGVEEEEPTPRSRGRKAARTEEEEEGVDID